jgi:hypothetical protein
LVLSIIAGANIKKIAAPAKHKSIVRSMPNTPGQIGEGITVWTASKEVSEEQQEMARALLGALGEEVFVEDESYLDMATALSGSGPAYVFLFTEALIDAGVHMGFPRRIAEQLVLQTIKGSASFYEQAARHPATYAIRNGTPAGHSAEGSTIWRRRASTRSRAVWAAYQLVEWASLVIDTRRRRKINILIWRSNNMKRLALITILIIILLSACGPAPAPTPIEDTLFVEPGTSLGSISPYLFGTNYGPMHAVPLDVLPLVENGGFTTLRFPGGAWTDTADMKNFQIDQLMAFSKQAGAMPTISVRLLGGKPETAAELVRYTNLKKKYGVTYWSIGNEPNIFTLLKQGL